MPISSPLSSHEFVGAVPVRLYLCLGLCLCGCDAGERTLDDEPIEAIEPGVEDSLTRAAPCPLPSRVRMASDPAGSVALFVSVGGDEAATAYQVADGNANVRLWRGVRLFSDVCNRIPDWGEPAFEEAWDAPFGASQHGTIEIEFGPGVTPDTLERATVRLFDVTLRRGDEPDAPELVIDELVMSPTVR